MRLGGQSCSDPSRTEAWWRKEEPERGCPEMEMIVKPWKWFVERLFPGTYDEYLEAKQIHLKEIRTYRKNPQYIIGGLLFVVPLIILIRGADWRAWSIAICIGIGDLMMRDTVSEHYCALINRERKRLITQPEESSSTKADFSCLENRDA